MWSHYWYAFISLAPQRAAAWSAEDDDVYTWGYAADGSLGIGAVADDIDAQLSPGSIEHMSALR